MIGRRLLVALTLMLTVGLATTACQPVVWTGSGGTTTPCYVGSWTLTGEQISSAVSSLGFPVTLTPTTGTGVTLTIAANGTWSLSADQTFTVSALSGAVSGTAMVNAQASGTYTATSTMITFTLTSLSGTVQFTGTFEGHAVNNFTVTLDQLGVDELYGLTGTATYTCGTSGPTLQFQNFSLDF